MRKTDVRLATVCVAALLVTLSNAFPRALNARQSYSFVKIADNSGALRAMANATLNNKGTVAFIGYIRGGGSAIMTGDARTLTTIADSSTFPDFNAPTINDHDIVAFSVREADGGRGFAVYAGTAGELVRIADLADGPYADLNCLATVNDRGYVVFWGQLAAGGERIAGRAIHSGSIETIIETNTEFGGFDQAPTVNNSGTVVFTATLQSGVNGVFTIRRQSISTIADSTGSFHVFSGAANINERGTVAFHAVADNAPAGIFTGSPKGVLQLVADETGGFANVQGGVGISNDGVVAFRASPVGAGAGIFTGPDPQDDAVVRIGDLIDGRMVTGTQFFRGLNDHGQVTFVAFFDGDYSAVYRADPKP